VQIQASIAETVRRQTEALGRKRTTAKIPVPKRSQNLQRNGQPRGKRTHRTADNQGSDDSDDANGEGGGKSSSSSAEEQSVEIKTKRYKRANGIEANIGSSSGLVAPSERLAWGKGGIRSNTRYGSANGGNGKSFRKTRIHKLIDHLQKSEENNNQVYVSPYFIVQKYNDLIAAFFFFFWYSSWISS